MITTLFHVTSKLGAILTGLKALSSIFALRSMTKPSPYKEDQEALRRIQEEGIMEGHTEMEKGMAVLDYQSRQALLRLCEVGVYGYSAYALVTEQVYSPAPYLVAAYAGYDLTKQLGNAYKATREVDTALNLIKNPTP